MRLDISIRFDEIARDNSFRVIDKLSGKCKENVKLYRSKKGKEPTNDFFYSGALGMDKEK